MNLGLPYNHAVLYIHPLPCSKALWSHVHAAGWPRPELDRGGGDQGDLAAGLTQGLLSIQTAPQVPRQRLHLIPVQCHPVPLGPLPRAGWERPVRDALDGCYEWWYEELTFAANISPSSRTIMRWARRTIVKSCPGTWRLLKPWYPRTRGARHSSGETRSPLWTITCWTCCWITSPSPPAVRTPAPCSQPTWHTSAPSPSSAFLAFPEHVILPINDSRKQQGIMSPSAQGRGCLPPLSNKISLNTRKLESQRLLKCV